MPPRWPATPPAVYVIEDAHWIDEVSESMLADFFTVIPQTPSLVLVTYRPEYRGALSRVPGAQTIALAPLSDSETAALVTELLGSGPLGRRGRPAMIAERAAGNPFFAEEIVRELAERGVLGATAAPTHRRPMLAEVSVPATLQATIAARIDRLDPAAKRTLERSGGHRLAVQPRNCWKRWALILSLRIWWAASSSIRSDSPGNPSMCSTIR